MCGRYNVTDSPAVRGLMASLGLPIYPMDRLNVSPGTTGQFIFQSIVQRQIQSGIWSLLIERKPDGRGFRPNPKYKTFNAQSRRLEQSRLWKVSYQTSRCIVPASGFHEWDGKQCFNITPENGDAFALGGLYRSFTFGAETVYAYTIITLPPQPQFAHIHSKSFPLTLLPEDFDAWLDPNFVDPRGFSDLLQAGIRFPIRATPISSPKILQPVAEAEIIQES